MASGVGDLSLPSTVLLLEKQRPWAWARQCRSPQEERLPSVGCVVQSRMQRRQRAVVTRWVNRRHDLLERNTKRLCSLAPVGDKEVQESLQVRWFQNSCSEVHYVVPRSAHCHLSKNLGNLSRLSLLPSTPAHVLGLLDVKVLEDLPSTKVRESFLQTVHSRQRSRRSRSTGRQRRTMARGVIRGDETKYSKLSKLMPKWHRGT